MLSFDSKEALYQQYLHKVSDIKLTKREVDILSCIIHNRSNKKVAELLSISYRTVEVHVRNIIGKINKFSREDIIDFAEQSNKMEYFKQYYVELLVQFFFKTSLLEIANLNKYGFNGSIKELKDLDTAHNHEAMITKKVQRLQKDLALANVTLKLDTEKFRCCYYELFFESKNRKNKIIICFEDKESLANKSDKLINFIENYYFAVLQLLDSIIEEKKLNFIINAFKEKYHNSQQTLLSNGNTINLLQNTKNDKLYFKRKNIILITNVLIVIAVLCSYFFIQPVYISQKYSPQNNPKLTAKSDIKLRDIDKQKTWNLPYLIDHYINREEITDLIYSKFMDQKNTVILSSLSGLGGIGKTTLAQYVILHPKQNYNFRGWFSSETIDLLKQSYFELGERYDLFPKNISDRQKIIRVKEWLENQKKLLLVYDNVEDMETLDEYLPRKGHIIITSRNYKLPGIIEIDIMTENEAIQLIDALVPKTTKQSENYKKMVGILVKELGYLPLALSQAGAYITENMLTVQEYLSLYTTEKVNLLSDKTMPSMDTHNPAHVTWNVNINQVGQAPEARLSHLKYVDFC
ncbi:LuxR C-terminal-related transcriptional regulator [Cysteiniphilum sp. 6C5]|uniref:response regulator transcription factor n=1 Tax=unclassified Cysteiniphilum TaxID=2610889 RepID=UPI003F855271